MKKITFEDITLKNDKNGICYNDYHNQLHIIGIDKKQYKYHTLKRKINNKYSRNIMFEDIPNEFAQYELLNPENIEVKYLMWFDADCNKTNEEIIAEIQEYKYKEWEVMKMIEITQNTAYKVLKKFEDERFKKVYENGEANGEIRIKQVQNFLHDRYVCNSTIQEAYNDNMTKEFTLDDAIELCSIYEYSEL